MTIVNWIKDNWVGVLAAIGAVQTAAAAIVKLTPTQKDDALLGKVVGLFAKVGGFLSTTKKE